MRKSTVYRERMWGYKEWGLRDKSPMLGVGDHAWGTHSGQREEVKARGVVGHKAWTTLLS